MKVLVTGAAGYLGSLLILHLLNSKVEVLGVDKLLYGGDALLPFLSDPNFCFEKLDITEGLGDKILGADFIVHLAALVGPLCDRNDDLAWKTNYEGTVKICNWAKKNGTKMIFASTCSNYGISEGVATEDSLLKPFGIYAETKVEAEKAVAELKNQAVILRFATMAGLSPRPRFDLLLNQLTYEAYSQGKIECHQPGAWRPFVHVADAARVIKTLLTDWSRVNHGCYNVVGFNTTKRELAEVIRNYTGCEIIEKSGSIDQRDYSVSAELIKKDIGFSPSIGISECVREIYSAFKLGIVQVRKEYYNLLPMGVRV